NSGLQMRIYGVEVTRKLQRQRPRRWPSIQDIKGHDTFEPPHSCEWTGRRKATTNSNCIAHSKPRRGLERIATAILSCSIGARRGNFWKEELKKPSIRFSRLSKLTRMSRHRI